MSSILPMEDPQWLAVDHYIADHLLGADPVLDEALERAEAAGLPAINVSATQGKLLHLLTRAHGSRRVLEIGTLGGYSAIWLGRAVGPTGQVLTIELEPAHAEVARANLERAGLAEVVEVREGRAVDVLAKLVDDGSDPFDLVFVDADKPSNPEYFAWAMRLTRPGALIVVDNVVRHGAIVDESNDDPGVLGTRRLFEAMAAERRVSATALQTVGTKGYDGLAVALVLDEEEGGGPVTWR